MKNFYALFLAVVTILIVSCNNDSPKRANSMTSDMSPCEISEYETGNYSITFADLELYKDVFKEFETEYGGYAWETIVLSHIELHNLNGINVEFDPESDMFAAYSSDLDSLLRVVIIKLLTKNHDKLRDTIKYAINTKHLRKKDLSEVKVSPYDGLSGTGVLESVFIQNLGEITIGSKVSHP